VIALPHIAITPNFVIPESRAADSSGIYFTARAKKIPDRRRFAACPG
jgi:hypothetical protein